MAIDGTIAAALGKGAMRSGGLHWLPCRNGRQTEPVGGFTRSGLGRLPRHRPPRWSRPVEMTGNHPAGPVGAAGRARRRLASRQQDGRDPGKDRRRVERAPAPGGGCAAAGHAPDRLRKSGWCSRAPAAGKRRPTPGPAPAGRGCHADREAGARRPPASTEQRAPWLRRLAEAGRVRRSRSRKGGGAPVGQALRRVCAVCHRLPAVPL